MSRFQPNQDWYKERLLSALFLAYRALRVNIPSRRQERATGVERIGVRDFYLINNRSTVFAESNSPNGQHPSYLISRIRATFQATAQQAALELENSIEGAEYMLQCNVGNDSSWTDVPTSKVLGTGSSVRLVDSSVQGPYKFYRVVKF